MVQLYVNIQYPTDPAWIDVVFDDFESFLQDHANCERKAAAMAMSFVAKYPDREKIIDPLVDLAREELQHFQEVFRLMQERGIPLQHKFQEDRYVNKLLKLCRHGKAERFLDRLLIASAVETRGAERFKIVYKHLKDKELKTFYHKLWADDAKHSNLFVEWALQYFDKSEVYDRLEYIMKEEGNIIKQLELIPAMH